MAPGSLLFTRAPFISSRYPCVLPPSLDIDLYFTVWILGLGRCLILDAFTHILLLHAQFLASGSLQEDVWFYVLDSSRGL